MESIEYKPIGVFCCDSDKSYMAPRQGVLASESEGVINLNPNIVWDSISDLSGCERIWIINDFHKNKNWKPKVMPPRGSETRRSVLATRSPYRPNGIGLTCAKLVKVEKRKLYVEEHDILDGTPILDIKPYVSYSDSFEGVQPGWIEEEDVYSLELNENAQKKIEWLNKRLSFDLISTLKNQLHTKPTCRKSKRVKTKGDHFEFSLQTWRFDFQLREKMVQLIDLNSGYSERDLSSVEDKYNDKCLHKEFIAAWQ